MNPVFQWHGHRALSGRISIPRSQAFRNTESTPYVHSDSSRTPERGLVEMLVSQSADHLDARAARMHNGTMCILCILEHAYSISFLDSGRCYYRMEFLSRGSSAKKSRELGHLHAQISAAPRLRYGRAKFGKGWEGMTHRDPRFL